jgi:spoIIIJ-associated protein
MMSLFEDEPTLESLEVTARTVNEAIDKALTQLGLTRDQVVVSVLSEGSRGILGIGQEDARILVSPREPIAPRPPPAPAPAPASVSTVSPEPVAPPARPRPQLSSEQVADLARDVLDNLLSGMRIPAEVEILPVPQNARDEGFQVMLNIVVGTDDVASLIGRRGENLSAIQFMTTLIASGGSSPCAASPRASPSGSSKPTSRWRWRRCRRTSGGSFTWRCKAIRP